MHELDKGLSIGMKDGPDRREALIDFNRQIREWGLTMPKVTPLVLDFGLDDFDRIGLIECWIANEPGAGYCGKFMFVFDGQTCPEHRHERKHETFFILKGRVRMRIDGHDHLLNQGCTQTVPPGIPHRFTGIGPTLLLELSMPCELADNCFSDARIKLTDGVGEHIG